MDLKQRKFVRGEREQLVTLVNGWDPAGLIAAGAPRNEYDSVVDELLEVLSTHGTADEVTHFLENEISRRFGVAPPDIAQFAKKAVNWFRMASVDQ